MKHLQRMPTYRDGIGRAEQTALPIESNSININPLKIIVMKTNKNAQKNNKVQKSEKETAAKVTALAIIPKPMTLICGQDIPRTAGVAEAPETATVPTVVEEIPQQATPKTPLATATAETDLDITAVHPSADNHRKTFNDTSLQELADSIREMGSYKPLPYVHARQAVTKSSTANATTVPHCLQEQRL